MRLALNFLITVCLLLAFNAMDWLTLSHDGSLVEFGNMSWPVVGSVLLVAVVLWAVSAIVSLLYAFSVVFTLGLMLLAYPFIGWAILEVTEHFMPDKLATHGFWITFICGFLLMFVQIPSPSEDE